MPRKHHIIGSHPFIAELLENPKSFGGKPILTAVRKAKEIGEWLDPATLRPFLTNSATFEKSKRREFFDTHRHELADEAEALALSESLAGWAAEDPAKEAKQAAKAKADLDRRRDEWVLARAEQIAVEEREEAARRRIVRATLEWETQQRINSSKERNHGSV